MTSKNDQVGAAETDFILTSAKHALSLSGDFVEFGCYKGDTSLLLANLIKNTAKTLYLYDSFEGLPVKSPKDQSPLGENFTPGALFVTKRELKLRFLRANLRLPIIKKAWFSDLVPSDLPDQISFAFLDGDFYESIKASLELITPHLVQNAIILIHDYQNLALPGVKAATDEWLKSHPAAHPKIYNTICCIIYPAL